MMITTKRLVMITKTTFRKHSVSAWEKIPLAPPDKILGLNESFKNDKASNKVNLGVGAYRDDNGLPMVLQSVREAEKRIVQKNYDHEYAGIAGMQAFVDLSMEFAYGSDSLVIKDKCVAGVQSLSGTGGCRLGAEFLSKFLGKGKKIYMPDPTWGNHIPIMRDGGLDPAKYRYYNPDTCSVDFDGMQADIDAAPAGSAFLLHACAHNPTGCDPTPTQWDELSQQFKKKQHIAFFDSAYQGFASGDPEVDAYSIRKFVSDGHLILLSQSYAKNFGLYGERIGTFSVVTKSPEETDRVNSQLKTLVRPMYSNPPIYGARLVIEILSDQALKSLWLEECKGMAERIKAMRSKLRIALEGIGSTRDWTHVTTQIGMFCFTGLTQEQVLEIRSKYHIYCTEDGRISMAGVTSKNVAYIAQAIFDVTK